MSTVTKTETPEETSAEKRRRLLQENRVRALNAPMRDPEFVQKIAQAEGKLRTAQKELEELRAGDPKRNRKLVRRAESRVLGLAEELAKLQNQERSLYLLYGEAREPIIRAGMRGEEVEAYEAETAEILRDEHGAKIIIRRGENRGLPRLKISVGLRAKKLTGLQRAYADGDLGEGPVADLRRETGNDYGEAYEIIQGMTSTSGEGGGGFGPKGPQPRVIEAGQLLRDMRAHIRERQTAVLDLVCGKGMRVGEAASEMGADPRTVRRLLAISLDDARRSQATERAKRLGTLEEAA